MDVKVYITTELFDKDGKLLRRRKRRSKSFVQAFGAILRAQFICGANVVSVQDIDGTARLVNNYADSFRSYCADNDSARGLVVGTGTNAVAVTDYKLQTQITHGASSGKLDYSAVSWGALIISDPYVSFTMIRDFTNSSGASITVNEEGIYGYGVVTTTLYTFCLIRDKEAAGIAVADGQNLRVTYTIQTST